MYNCPLNSKASTMELHQSFTSMEQAALVEANIYSLPGYFAAGLFESESSGVHTRALISLRDLFPVSCLQSYNSSQSTTPAGAVKSKPSTFALHSVCFKSGLQVRLLICWRLQVWGMKPMLTMTGRTLSPPLSVNMKNSSLNHTAFPGETCQRRTCEISLHAAPR